jgi:hypothetical protein
MRCAHQAGLSFDDGQHAMLGTGRHAAAASQTSVDIDLRMLGERPVCTFLPGLTGFPGTERIFRNL